MQTIVVGVDGSDNAEHALTLAADEAVLRGARLRPICVWEDHPGYAEAEPETLDALRASADAVVRAAVASVRRLHPELDCEGETREGQPAHVLLQAAENADPIVVGNRGRGGFASLLLGSVSQQVVHHAACPVLVVPWRPRPK
jgi:nucleotide-binding universal stress UspA family protein